MKRFLCITALGIAIAAIAAANAPAATLEDYLASAPFKMPAVPVPAFQDRNFSITDFGAVGDGHTLNTTAFARAIDACAQAGGGHVTVPAGLWLEHSIITALRGFRATDAADITLKQVKIETRETPAIVQKNTSNVRILD